MPVILSTSLLMPDEILVRGDKEGDKIKQNKILKFLKYQVEYVPVNGMKELFGKH